MTERERVTEREGDRKGGDREGGRERVPEREKEKTIRHGEIMLVRYGTALRT